MVALILFMRETRTSVVLTGIAKDIRRRTGNEQYIARIELEKPSLKSLLIVSCTRPLCKWLLVLSSDRTYLYVLRLLTYRANCHQY